MLTLLVPILINYLLEGDQLQHASKYQLSLHQQSFQWLNKIGPKYPQVLSSCLNKFVFKYKIQNKHKLLVSKYSMFYFRNLRC